MRILITGASGRLGRYLIDAAMESGHEWTAWSGPRTGMPGSDVPLRPVDITDREALECALDTANPDVVLHAAAISTPAEVVADMALAWAVNVEATAGIANWCARHNRRLVTVSTDQVFDGANGWYKEDDQPCPVAMYGRTKRAAELAGSLTPDCLVVRLSLLFGFSRSSRIGFFDSAVAALRAGKPQMFFIDEFRTPLDFSTAANTLLRLSLSPVNGIVHLGGSERMSRFELMTRVAPSLGLDQSLVGANLISDAAGTEPRARDLSLDCSHLREVFPGFRAPRVEEAIAARRSA